MFGVDGAQRERIDGFVATPKALFFRTQLIGRLIPNLYQSMIYLLLVGGPRRSLRGRRRPRRLARGASSCCSCERARTASRCRAPTRRCASRCRSSNACRKPQRRYERERPAARRASRCEQVQTVAFEHVSFAYRPGRPVLTDISFEVRGGEAIGIIGPSGRGQVDARADPAAAATPDRGPLPGQRRRRVDEFARAGLAPARRLRPPGAAPAARDGRGQHPLLPRHRRRGGRARRRGSRASTTTSWLARRLRDDRRPARRRRLRRPAAAHLPRARARRAPRGARARRAHERARPALRDADPGVADARSSTS